MKLKQGVVSRGMSPEILLAVMVANEAYARHGFELVITSIADGRHSLKSKHYRGDAVDLRTKHLTGGYKGPMARQIASEIKADLGEHYDVILEDTHIHVEYDPRRPA